ncbi:hypothetical protein BKA56DRAFT_665241 [Ilyonectria sp. MPI-CAGE-AT-0026]|nr:hypothetical protein BKA56DRAFT_665241 [Ilyonectria sp. MPI-CAGE-AT-0026]
MDENLTLTPAAARHKGAVSAASSAISAPLPGNLRRAFTASAAVDDARRSRPSIQLHSPFAEASSPTGEAFPRRSSNFSEYSLSEARDLLNPQPMGHAGDQLATSDSSSLASLSLAFALLPALAGVLFKNGSAVVTDIMLLGLAGVFLHWSVTQPWTWYHSAQEVRIQQEANADTAIEDDSDSESATLAPARHSSLDHVPEEEATQPEAEGKATRKRPTAQQQSALAELYLYEILALASCFMLPLIGAYMLHAIRSQLSRPSEGLVSNYNLTIFLLVSELRVFSHMIKLVQSRTLHLQRVVQGNHNGFSTTHNAEQLEAVLLRLECLESRLTTEENPAVSAGKSDTVKAKQENAIARDVRNAIQPELDALNRAVRRYEKKATLLQFQTESRFAGVDARLEDAIALAANVAKNSASNRNIFLWTIEALIAVVLLPFKALLRILLLPLSTLLTLAKKNKKKGSPAKISRSSRSGKAGTQPRYSGDRVPTRVSRK